MKNGWQDISKAPKDGSPILVFGNDRYVYGEGWVGGPYMAVAAYVGDPDEFGYDWRVCGASVVWVMATHWQPKPEDPT